MKPLKLSFVAAALNLAAGILPAQAQKIQLIDPASCNTQASAPEVVECLNDSGQRMRQFFEPYGQHEKIQAYKVHVQEVTTSRLERMGGTAGATNSAGLRAEYAVMQALIKFAEEDKSGFVNSSSLPKAKMAFEKAAKRVGIDPNVFKNLADSVCGRFGKKMEHCKATLYGGQLKFLSK